MARPLTSPVPRAAWLDPADAVAALVLAALVAGVAWPAAIVARPPGAPATSSASGTTNGGTRRPSRTTRHASARPGTSTRATA